MVEEEEEVAATAAKAPVVVVVVAAAVAVDAAALAATADPPADPVTPKKKPLCRGFSHGPVDLRPAPITSFLRRRKYGVQRG